jgi:hypothetical protein
MKAKPHCETVMPWLKANLGKHCLAPLTGTDFRALQAAVQIIELSAYDDSPEVIEAFAKIVRRMQPKCQGLAYYAIAYVLDWGDRSRIWRQAGLPERKAAPAEITKAEESEVQP